MVFGMGFLQVGDGEPEVALGGGQGAMAQESLHVAQVAVILEQMGGAGAPPNVTGHMLLDSSQPGVARDQGADGVVDGQAAQRPGGLSFAQQAPGIVEGPAGGVTGTGRDLDWPALVIERKDRVGRAG